MDRLYDIQFDETFGDEVVNYMYYRSNRVILHEPGDGRRLPKKENYDFFTYFNSLSVAKWRIYTTLKSFSLVIEAKGDFELFVFGHYQISTGAIKKEYYCKQRIISEEKTQIVVSIPEDAKATVVGFSIYTHKFSRIYDAF